MIANPATKMTWIEKHWSESDANAAKDWFKASMLEFRQAARRAAKVQQATTSQPPTPSSLQNASHKASRALARGLSKLDAMEASIHHRRTASSMSAASELSRSVSASSITETDASTCVSSPAPLSDEEKAEIERQELAEDWANVDDE
ncbi:hypothetical protein HWV62_13162 [Athelia sp. TMB]|nr:hypothetical protein HWV62_13162 [Athelia sp. TMB]